MAKFNYKYNKIDIEGYSLSKELLPTMKYEKSPCFSCANRLWFISYYLNEMLSETNIEKYFNT